MTAQVQISLDVNGERVEANVPPRLNLADFLREHLQLTGTHVGCEHGVCGAEDDSQACSKRLQPSQGPHGLGLAVEQVLQACGEFGVGEVIDRWKL